MSKLSKLSESLTGIFKSRHLMQAPRLRTLLTWSRLSALNLARLWRPAASPSSLREKVIREEGGGPALVLRFLSAWAKVEVFIMRFEMRFGAGMEKRRRKIWMRMDETSLYMPFCLGDVLFYLLRGLSQVRMRLLQSCYTCQSVVLGCKPLDFHRALL